MFKALCPSDGGVSLKVHVRDEDCPRNALNLPYITVRECTMCMHAQSRPTLCDPMDYTPPGSSVHGIFQARILEWIVLRCPGKAGNPFLTTQGNRLSCRDQEGRRGSEEAVAGPSCSPRGNPACRGTFGGRMKAGRILSALQSI